MQDNNARQAFVEAIEADPYDMDARKVYADWLDEFGTDSDAEEAVVQRAWTVEKQEAIEWVNSHAKLIGLAGSDLIDAANVYLETGESLAVDMDLDDEIVESVGKFWKMFCLITGKEVSEDNRGRFVEVNIDYDDDYHCAC